MENKIIDELEKEIERQNKLKEIEKLKIFDELEEEIKKQKNIKKYKKKSIPKAIKNNVWNLYFNNLAEGFCKICKCRLIRDNWECGHIIAESKGGETIVSNLTVLCSQCNKSMGSNNLEDFMKKYGIDN